jgi:alpha-1,3-glucan synthase
MRNPDRASVASDISEDYFAQRRDSTINGSPGTFSTPQQDYRHFLDRVNRQIARDKKHVPDPFLDPGMAAPNLPFGAYSHVSSVESISSIVGEKQNSPLKKAIASVSFLIRFPYLPLIGVLFSSRIRTVLRPILSPNSKL